MDGEESDSVLIPKSALGGKEWKEGDTITLTVKNVFEDEVEAEASNGAETETESAEPDYNAELDQLAKE